MARRLFLVSNMYPSSKNVRYGIFVKRSKEALDNEYDVHKIVLTKKTGFLCKLTGYIVLYYKVFKLFFTATKNDLIYVHYPLYFSPLLVLFKWKKTPLILNFHGSDAIFDSRTKLFFSICLKYIVAKCHIVVPSKYYREKISEVFNISNDSFLVYPSGGVDHSIFRPIKREKHIFVFGYVSNFILKKGWNIFLETLQNLKESNKIDSFKAIMVGDGPDLEKIKKKVELSSFQVDIVSSVEQDKLAEIYAMFSVFIFPTYREDESLGLVGIEAMTCGLPVIAGSVGGPMGYVNHGKNGFIFEKADASDLSQKIMDYMNLSQYEKNKMRENCLETAKRYESNKVRKELLVWLNNI